MDALLQKALALATHGFSVFPVDADKHPLEKGGFANGSTAEARIREMFANPRAAEVAVSTGEVSDAFVLDIDCGEGKKDRVSAQAWYEGHRDLLAKLPFYRTKSGGLHYWFRHIPDMGSGVSLLAPGIDILASRRFAVYWGDVPAEAIPEAPAWLYGDIAEKAEKRTRARCEGGKAAGDPAPDPDSVIRLLNAMPNPLEIAWDQWIAINLAVQGTILGLEAVGRLEDREHDIREAAIAWSDRWEGGATIDVADKWNRDFSIRTNDLASWRQLMGHAAGLGVDVDALRTATAAVSFPPVPDEPATGDEASDQSNDWRVRLMRSKEGKVLPNMANIKLTLANALDWQGALGWNEFADRPLWLLPPPWQAGTQRFTPRELRDVDFVRALAWLQQQNGILTNSKEAVADAVIAAAEEHPFNPVTAYLDGLKWDGKPRLDTLLIDFLGAEDTPLNRVFTAKTLIAAVARAYRPGCKVKTVLLLEGAQDIGKSAFCKKLMPDESWFTDNLPDIGSKDCYQQLPGKWLVEMSELTALSKADAAKVKQFISSDVDRYRPSYGRMALDYPRRCIFIGSLNRSGVGYLKDETGATRFWPIEVGIGWTQDGVTVKTVDGAALEAARDQVWAEAVHRYRAGEPWWLTEAAHRAAHTEAAAERTASDAWEPVITEFVAGRPLVTQDAIIDHLGIPLDQQDDRALGRVGKVMTQLGWVGRQRRVNGERRRFYFPTDDAEMINAAIAAWKRGVDGVMGQLKEVVTPGAAR